MKLGMTRTRSPGTPKSRTVSSRRKSETAVSPADFRMEKRVMAWKEGWSPNRVMSVPCRVVTTGSSSPVSRSISRATQAEVAWGMA